MSEIYKNQPRHNCIKGKQGQVSQINIPHPHPISLPFRTPRLRAHTTASKTPPNRSRSHEAWCFLYSGIAFNNMRRSAQTSALQVWTHEADKPKRNKKHRPLCDREDTQNFQGRSAVSRGRCSDDASASTIRLRCAGFKGIFCNRGPVLHCRIPTHTRFHCLSTHAVAGE
jgi:hypothetical protein